MGRNNSIKTIVECSVDLLKEFGTPLSAKFIAVESLKRGWITSKAKNEVKSMVATIDKSVLHHRTEKLLHTECNHTRLVTLARHNN